MTRRKLSNLEEHTFNLARNLDVQGLQMLFGMRLDPHVRNEEGHTLMHVLPFGEDTPIEKLEKTFSYLLKKGLDPSAEDDQGCPVIFNFCSGDNTISITKQVIESGKMDVNFVDSKKHHSLLMIACLFGAKDTVKLLLEKGADINFKGKDRKTAYDMLDDGWRAAADKRTYGDIRDMLDAHEKQRLKQQREDLNKVLNSIQPKQSPTLKRRPKP